MANFSDFHRVISLNALDELCDEHQGSVEEQELRDFREGLTSLLPDASPKSLIKGTGKDSKTVTNMFMDLTWRQFGFRRENTACI